MVFNTLSGRFLGLMVVFVVIAEVLIFVPSVARFRADYLQNRLEMAQLAVLAQLATPSEDGVGPDLRNQLLATAGVLNVVLRRDDVRELMLESPIPGPVQETFYLKDADRLTLMRDALRVFLAAHDRIIRVIGVTRQGAKSEIEVTLHEWPLREAMGTLVRGETKHFSASVQPYLRDVHDHVVQLLDLLENCREMSSSLIELHMSTSNNRLNEVIKLLTIISTIFMPLTFIVGIYGMNFDVMPELRWWWGYPACLALMAVVAVTMAPAAVLDKS